MVKWTEAVLTVRTEECMFAILPFDGRLCVAAERLEEKRETVPGLSGLNPHRPDRYESTSGLVGSWIFTAAYLPAPTPRGGGPSWQVADNGEVWLACGLAAEAPTEWEREDGDRVPTDFARAFGR